MTPNDGRGFVEERQDDGTSVCTLGKAAYVPIHNDEEEA